MTPLGCPDCLLIRYEHRALRARLRARARARHHRTLVFRLGCSVLLDFLAFLGLFVSLPLPLSPSPSFFPYFVLALLSLSLLSLFRGASHEFVVTRALNQAPRHLQALEILDASAISLDVAAVASSASGIGFSHR